MKKVAVTEVLDVNQVLAALIAFKKGDFSVRLPVNQVGLPGKIADTLNDIFELNENMATELARISTAVGKEGKIGQRAALAAGAGDWASCVESVNSLISDLVQPSTEIARVIGAVAQGDLSQKMSLEVEGRPLQGEFVRTARVVNTMVDQLNSFASEVTRVAREVGTEGKLGGQAVVTGVAGTWKDLTDSVNSMASNLTNQVRNIAVVTSAMLRTWFVRFDAMELTESVRSFQVPATPVTTACPPSLPSVPTSRATRVTSDAKELSWSTMVLTTRAVRTNSPCSGRPSTSSDIFCERSPCATAPITRAISVEGCTRSEMRLLTDPTQSVHRPDPRFRNARCPIRPSLPTADRFCSYSVALLS